MRLRPPSKNPLELIVNPTHFAKEQLARARAWLRKHESTLWWLHSAYALLLGVLVMVFGSRGFEHAKALLTTITATWFLLFSYFQWQQLSAHKVSSFVISYALKNLYQTAFFFSLPFFYRASTLDSPNAVPLVLLVVLVLLSTIDRVFDGFVLKKRGAAVLMQALCLFFVAQLAAPAVFAELPTDYGLELATLLAVCAGYTIFTGYFSSLSPNRIRTYLLAAAVIGSSLAAMRLVRPYTAPVPLYMDYGALGTEIASSGRPSAIVSEVDATRIRDLVAVTEIVLPNGKGDTLSHRWYCGEQVLGQVDEQTMRVFSSDRLIRLRSTLRAAPIDTRALFGARCHVDVETQSGRLVGRLRFRVNGPS
jgi:hypothetical protein